MARTSIEIPCKPSLGLLYSIQLREKAALSSSSESDHTAPAAEKLATCHPEGRHLPEGSAFSLVSRKSGSLGLLGSM